MLQIEQDMINGALKTIDVETSKQVSVNYRSHVI